MGLFGTDTQQAGKKPAPSHRADRGATALTYGLVVGLVAIGGLAAVTRIGDSIDTLFSTTSSTLVRALPSEGAATAEPSPTGETAQYTSCAAAYAAGERSDGIYRLDPDNDGQDIIRTFCDMTRDGGGWTLVFNISDDVGMGSMPDITYAQATDTGYSEGSIGNDLEGFNIWVATKYWNDLSATGRYRIDEGPSQASLDNSATYSGFSLSQDGLYTMSCSLAGGSQNEYCAYNLTTKDRDQDIRSGNGDTANCAYFVGGPGWYNACSYGLWYSMWPCEPGTHGTSCSGSQGDNGSGDPFGSNRRYVARWLK